MNKAAIKKDMKGFYNGVRVYNGVTIAHVGWKCEPWLIIENNETFEEARQDNFSPILSFRTKYELIKAL